MCFSGDSLVFTDIHFGLRNDSVSRLDICVKVIDDIIARIAEEKKSSRNGISNIIFCGDWFHVRNAINVNTMNVAMDCLKRLEEAVPGSIVFIVGNHDIFNKNTTDVNSVNIFRESKKVVIVDHVTEGTLNGQKVLFCPWLSDFSGFKKETFDHLFGHFDVPDNYIAQTYIDEHNAREKVSKSVENMLDSDPDVGKAAQKNDGLGDYVELAKMTGIVWSGHIHQHREFKSKGRKFIFIGSPYQQNTGEAGFESGFYILDSTGGYRFLETRGVPKHVKIRMSDIVLHGVDGYDFSGVKGNIVRKIYDCEIDRVLDSEISRKIADNGPYEELNPEYEVSEAYDDSPDKNTIELIKKSEIQYIRNYIDTIDKDVLDKEELDPKELYSVMESYYKKAVGV